MVRDEGWLCSPTASVVVIAATTAAAVLVVRHVWFEVERTKKTPGEAEIEKVFSITTYFHKPAAANRADGWKNLMRPGEEMEQPGKASAAKNRERSKKEAAMLRAGTHAAQASDWAIHRRGSTNSIPANYSPIRLQVRLAACSPVIPFS
jgi:hypothetical protein